MGRRKTTLNATVDGWMESYRKSLRLAEQKRECDERRRRRRKLAEQLRREREVWLNEPLECVLCKAKSPRVELGTTPLGLACLAHPGVDPLPEHKPDDARG